MIRSINLLKAFQSGLRHVLFKRITKRYPYADSGLPETYYSYNPKMGLATAGWKGRHYLEMNKCTGCQLCSIMCDEISNSIIMVELTEEKQQQNKKSIFPSIDYGRCVFCGLCVDSCPFGCLHMTPQSSLADYDRKKLWYSPKELNVLPKVGIPSSIVGKKKVEG